MALVSSPPHRLWLEGDVLVSRRGLRTTRLALASLVSIRIEWVWRAGNELVLRSDDHAIYIRALDARTRELRAALAAQLESGAARGVTLDQQVRSALER